VFCVITLIAGEDGPEKGRFEFERLGILLQYIAMQGTSRACSH